MNGGGCGINGGGGCGNNGGGCGINGGGCGINGCNMNQGGFSQAPLGNQALLNGVQGQHTGFNGNGNVALNSTLPQHAVIPTLDQSQGTLNYNCKKPWQQETAPLCLDFNDGQSLPILMNKTTGQLLVDRGQYPAEELDWKHSKPLVEAYKKGEDERMKLIAGNYKDGPRKTETQVAESGAAGANQSQVADRKPAAEQATAARGIVTEFAIMGVAANGQPVLDANKTAGKYLGHRDEIRDAFKNKNGDRVIFTASWCGPCQETKKALASGVVTSPIKLGGVTYTDIASLKRGLGLHQGSSVYYIDIQAVQELQKYRNAYNGEMGAFVDQLVAEQTAAVSANKGDIPALAARQTRESIASR